MKELGNNSFEEVIQIVETSRSNAYQKVFGIYVLLNSTVLVHIRNLRVKLEEDPGNPKFIKTIWGKGHIGIIYMK